MKVVLAPNAFKGSLTAVEAAEAMAAGIRKVRPDAVTECVPVADGGDGLVDVVLASTVSEERRTMVRGPRGTPVEASWAWIPDRRTAVIEMARASGLAILREEEKNPMLTSTYGTGELVCAALEAGAQEIFMGIGGSATNDGAMGVAAALGMRFLDAGKKELEPVGGQLGRVQRIDTTGLHFGLPSCRITVVCDVDNPLLGPTGAARVYAPQKGASPEQVEALEQGLANLAERIATDLGRDVRTLPGGGAAGGMGAGLYGFFRAELKRGIDIVLELVELERKLQNADLVISAEGRLDGQTAYGKAPAGVGALAKKHRIPCIAIAGGYQDDLGPLHEVGINAVFTLCPGPVSLDNAMQNASDYLYRTTEQVFRAFLGVFQKSRDGGD